MRSSALVLALLTAVPSIASADRFTFGVSVARRDDRDSRSPGLFAELRVIRRLSLRLEMSHDGSPDTGTATQRLGGAAIVDVGRGGRVTPFLLAGIGTERARSSWGTDDTREAEVGVGLSATVAGDLVLTIDARVGEMHRVDKLVPLADRLWAPDDDRYTSLRAGVGIRF